MRFKIKLKAVKPDDPASNLDIGDDYMVVTTHNGKVIIDWDDDRILDQVETPSFLRNRKLYGFRVGATLFDFTASEEARRELQRLLDRMYVRRHPDAASRAVLFGIGKAAGGVLMVGVAIGLTILANMDGPSRPVWFAGMVIGAVLFVQGLYQASTAGKWRKVAAEVEEGDERRRQKAADRRRRDSATKDDQHPDFVEE
jgi:hypothetical protein